MFKDFAGFAVSPAPTVNTDTIQAKMPIPDSNKGNKEPLNGSTSVMVTARVMAEIIAPT